MKTDSDLEAAQLKTPTQQINNFSVGVINLAIVVGI
jgi:hypothetical protein